MDRSKNNKQTLRKGWTRDKAKGEEERQDFHNPAQQVEVKLTPMVG